MFTKTLFFLLIVCTVTYVSEAEPIDTNFKEKLASTVEKLKSDLRKVEEDIESFLKKAGNQLKAWWDKLTGKEAHDRKVKLEHLKSRYEALRQECDLALKAKMEEADRKVAYAEANLKQTKVQTVVELENELTVWKVQFEQLEVQISELTKS